MKNILMIIVTVLLIIGTILTINFNTSLYIIELILIVTNISYLLLSRFNKKNFKEIIKNKDKIIILILSNILFVPIIFYVGNSFTNKENEFHMENDEENKTEITLDMSNVVSSNTINLNEYSSSITIKSAGTYYITGEFSNSIIVSASDTESVVLVLNDVKINTSNTATIIGLSGKDLTIENYGENTLSDGGSSTYDGCIYSNIPLIFTGTGKLDVNGNQSDGEGIATEEANITFNSGIYVVTSNDDGINAGGDGATIEINNGVFYIDASGDGIDSNKNAIINGGTIFVMGSDVGGDAGIDTDEGYAINGGTVVALGSDMIETPLNTSTQKYMGVTLDSSISAKTIVTLMYEETEIISFKATKSFKTIIISTPNLKAGTYTLYKNSINTGNISYGIYESNVDSLGEEVKSISIK